MSKKKVKFIVPDIFDLTGGSDQPLDTKVIRVILDDDSNKYIELCIHDEIELRSNNGSLVITPAFSNSIKLQVKTHEGKMLP